MTRLDSAIRRLTAQRACLDRAIGLIADVPGPVLELGLGNGRTYDHLRCRLPDREIFVFDRKVAAHPDCVPDADHLILGNFEDALPAAAARLPAKAALAHCDIGSGDKAASALLARNIAPLLALLLAPGAIVAGDQDMGSAGWRALPLPPDVAPGRYYLYRVERKS